MVAGTRVSALGIIFLIVGLSLLVIGGSQLFLQVQKNGILLNNVGLKAGGTIEADIGSASLNTATGNQLNAITIVSQPANVPVIAEIKSSSGEIVSQFKVDKNPFITSFTGQSDKQYTLLIKNVGDKEVTLQAAVINFPADPNNILGTNVAVWQSNTLMLVLAVAAGAVLSTAGIIIVIVGTIKAARNKSAADKQKTQKKKDATKYPYTGSES
jgi:hypothetical protein